MTTMEKIMSELADIMIEACERDRNFELAERLRKYVKEEGVRKK